jgi:low affinity Fe/Cu permease
MDTDNMYWVISRWIGWIVGFVVFLASYYYCITTYGYLLGFGLGWLPSFMAAGLAGLATLFLWPVAAVGIIYLLNPGLI